MHVFGGEVYEMEFTEICQQHSRVIPAESYAALDEPEERLRAITLLQQKAHSLEAEIAERISMQSKQKKILVVDDEVDILAFLQEILEQEGYIVVTTDKAEYVERLHKACQTSFPSLRTMSP
jgi:PleD family two-component response regulator